MKRVGSFLLLLSLVAAAIVHAAPPIRVAILDGQSAGAYHNWRLTTPVLEISATSSRIWRATRQS
jgi:uncharacterized protein